MLELKDFEQATEIVQKVVRPTNLVYSDYFSEMCGNKVYLKPEICSLPAHIRFAVRITRSAH